ncbi:hypothetical protein CC1G_05410 [Coprinopsis cinerea okayama7|uniref:DUF6534 domain-containing protein n=1 Tax=Coprinopsis cinerea (strain Okayama-7 / 130 / ATCC MYA-4618 / FGSC 9003) TaxID=240176 RepID=A8NQ06_COPC7|nr:hypothetical protein CC1G_05410 [Coprinopsis cinerea okayama7\|eukprot:XP_001835448.2 hypothetical protein CC1G_05410 [Coprinopsis cinerea okayama7\
MGIYAPTLGALLAGVFLNTWFYGIVTYQYASYYASSYSTTDANWVRFTVLGLFLTDTFHSISIMYMVWIYAVDGYGMPETLLVIHWPLPLSAVSMSIIALLVQLFLSYRIYLFSNRNKIYFAMLAAISLCGSGLRLTLAVRVWQAGTMPALVSINAILTAWLSLEVTIDILIAGILLYVFRRASTGLRRSDAVLRKLMRLSLQTGLCTAIFAVMCMILRLALPDTHFYLTVGFSICRVYTCTLMDTLLSRRELRTILDGGATTGNDGGVSIFMTLPGPSVAQPDRHRDISGGSENDSVKH